MKIISFDVGIKNMAYCIFDISDTSCKIHEWTVANLLEDESEIEIKYTCQCPSIAKPSKKTITKICGKQAKYKSPDNQQTYFCDKHAKSQTNWRFPESRFSDKCLKKTKMDGIIQLYEEILSKNPNNQIDRPKKRADMIDIINNNLRTTCLQSITIKKSILASEIDLITIGKRIKEHFDKVPIQDLSVVLIENQISPIANRMKCIQGMLAQYFIMRYEMINIQFISSSNKLKMFDKKEIECKNESQGQKYKEHKKDGVIFCKQLFDTYKLDPSWLLKLDTKKKDDLADCFLQGIWFLQKEKVLVK